MEEGDHILHVCLSGEAVPKCPYKMNVKFFDRAQIAALNSVLTCEGKKFKTLESVVFTIVYPNSSAKKQSFVLDERAQSVDCKKEAKVSKANNTLTVTTTFTPTIPGRYTLVGRSDSFDVKGSPLEIVVVDGTGEYLSNTKLSFLDQKIYSESEVKFKVTFPPQAAEALSIFVTGFFF